MNLYRVFPEPREMHYLEEAGTAPTIDGWYAPPSDRSVRLSMISSPSGRLVGPDGTSSSLSNPVDRAILRSLRGHADAVITGATTARMEPVPIPAHAPLVIVTSSGNLEGHKIIESTIRPEGVLVVSGSAATHSPKEFFPPGVAQHLVWSEDAYLRAIDVVSGLATRGAQHLLVEGGRSVAEMFASENTLDEVCLSLTGPPLSENHPPLSWWGDSWGEWSASHVLTDDLKTLYMRYHRVS